MRDARLHMLGSIAAGELHDTMPSRRASRAVQTACRLNTPTLQTWADELERTSERGEDVVVVVARATELSQNMHDQIFALFQANMEEMYEANGIWDVRSKRAELQHASSRYLLALPASDAEPASVARVCRRSARHMKGAPDTPTPLYGFIMWRFDTDDTVDGDPCADPGDDEVEVSYCYELQVDAAYRGRHIGTRLLTTLEHVSWRAHMRKVALTVFHMNQGARAFYKQRGYTADVTSPTADTNKEDEVDEVHYMILSTCNPSIKHS